MIIKILGIGCKNCQKLEQNVTLALEKSSKQATIEKVTDVIEISQYNALKTPGLVIDEKLVSYGRVNEVDEIIQFLE